MQNTKQHTIEFLEMYQDEILENHRLEKEREFKINSVFGLMDTRHLIFKQKKQILQDERKKTEEDLIDQYFEIKCRGEIEKVKANFISVIRGKYLMRDGRSYFQKNFTKLLKEDTGLNLSSSLKVNDTLRALPNIYKRNKDYMRGAIYRTVKKFTVECDKYFEIMEQRTLKRDNGEQFIIEHEGVTYKLFNRAGNKINIKTNNNFLGHYMKDAVTTVEAERKLLSGLRKYMQRYN